MLHLCLKSFYFHFTYIIVNIISVRHKWHPNPGGIVSMTLKGHMTFSKLIRSNTVIAIRLLCSCDRSNGHITSKTKCQSFQAVSDTAKYGSSVIRLIYTQRKPNIEKARFCNVCFIVSAVGRWNGKDICMCLLIHTFKICPSAGIHCIFDFWAGYSESGNNLLYPRNVIVTDFMPQCLNYLTLLWYTITPGVLN